MKVTAYIIVLLQILAVNLIVGSDSELTVRIKNGLLRGKHMQTKNGRNILGFIGIPYAKPPVGELRFKPPALMDNWDGVKTVTEMHPMCMQLNTFIRKENVEGVEDCLFLSVYTPKIDKDTLLPVMVYLHGGGYHAGFGGMHTPEYLLDKDVILVSINYRLGPMGFLTSGDTVVPGNMGMKDQTLALKWVQDNIIHFGGDQNSVTIFGNSAGGGSTHLHMLSPLSKGLFHGAISQSGTAAVRWAFEPLQKGVKMSKQFASILNCPVDNSKEMIECLRKVDAEELIKAQKQLLIWDIEPTVLFKPVIEPKHDGAFIYETVEESLKQGLGSDVPWMTGITTQEGALRSASVIVNPHLMKEFNEKFEENAYLLLYADKSEIPRKLPKLVKGYYFGRGDIDVSDEENLTNMYSDAYFYGSGNQAIDYHTKYLKSPVYAYLFGYRGSLSHSELFTLGNTKDFGVSHADELLYLFPVHTFCFPGRQPTENDEKMVEVLTTLWTNFAIYKNPTPNNSQLIWTAVLSEENEYLNIANDNEVSMQKSWFKERIQFWKEMENLIGNDKTVKVEL